MARLGRGYTRPRYIRPVTSGVVNAATSLDAVSTLTAAALRTTPAGATLAASSALTSGAGVTSPASATLAASSALTAGAVRSPQAATTLAATSTLAATPGATGEAILTATSGLTAGALQTRAAGAVLAAVSTLTAPARQTHQAAATLAATSTLVPGATRVQPVGAVLAASSALAAGATPVRPAAAVLAAASQLTVGSVLRTAMVAATLASVSTLSASAQALAGGQLNISLWGVDRANGNRRVPLPHHLKLTLADIDAQIGTIAFDYPVRGKNFWLLNRDVAGDSDLEVEVWLGGRASTAMRGYVSQRDGDEVAERATVRFTGSLMNCRFEQTQVEPQTGNEKKELVFAGATPGAAMLFLLGQAQARGALTDITVDFTALLDSNGVPWAETFSGKWSSSKTDYLQILQKLNTLGLCEFELTAGKVWRLYNFGGRGTDRTTGRAVMLRRGRNVTEANRRASSRAGGTTLFLDGSEGLFASYTDPTALARRGRRVEVAASAGNIAEQSALNATAQQLGSRIGKGLVERTFGLAFGVGHPRPGVHFGLGDLVLVETSGVQGSERVAQIQLDADAGGLSGSAVCGDLIADRAAALEARLAEQANGGVTVGTSTPTTEDKVPPGAPTGLTAGSVAYQDEDAGETYARVDVGWVAPTLNGDGDNDPRVQAAELIRARMQAVGGDPVGPTWTWPLCPQIVLDYAPTLLGLYPGDPADESASSTWLGEFITENGGPSSAATDVEGYQVRYAYLGLYQVGGIPSSEPWADNLLWHMATPEGGVRSTSYSFGGVGAGVAVRIQVRAFDRSANFGAWSSPVDLDTAVDNVPPPQMQPLTGRIWFRTVDLTTSYLGSAGEALPFDTDHAEIWLCRAASFDVPDEASTATAFDPDSTEPQHVANLYSAGTWNQPDLPTGVGWYAAARAVDRAGNASPLSEIVGPFTAEKLVGDDLVNEIIDATKLSPDSVQSQHVVNLAVTSGKMADLAVIRAKIANAAIGDLQVEGVSAGKVQTGTLVAVVTLTGTIQTAPSGLRWIGDPAGIRFFNASGVKTIDLQGASGNTLITGTLQSGLSGERWVMMPDGSLRLYPAAGSNYSSINNLGSDLMLRGPLDANNRSGRMNVSNIGVGLNFSAESEIPNNLRSEVVVFDRYARTTAPLIEFRVDQRYSAPNNEQRILFKQLDGSGADIAGSTMHWKNIDAQGPGFLAVQRDSGIKLGNVNSSNSIGNGRVYITDAAGTAFRSLQASQLLEGSSELGKAEIRPALDALAQDRMVDVIDRVHGRTWKRRPGPGKRVRKGARPQFGLVAEELARIAPELVDGVDGPAELMAISPMSVATVAWEGVRETRAEVAELVARIDRLEAQLAS